MSPQIGVMVYSTQAIADDIYHAVQYWPSMNHFACILLFNTAVLITILGGGCHDHHFTDESGTYKDKVICPRSHALHATEKDLNPDLSEAQTQALNQLHSGVKAF